MNESEDHVCRGVEFCMSESIICDVILILSRERSKHLIVLNIYWNPF